MAVFRGSNGSLDHIDMFLWTADMVRRNSTKEIEVLKGTVKFFDQGKGCGFITDDRGGKDA